MKNDHNSKINSKKFITAFLITIFGVILMAPTITLNTTTYAQNNNTSISNSDNKNQTTFNKISPMQQQQRSSTPINQAYCQGSDCSPSPPPCPPNCPPPPNCPQSDIKIRICPPPGGFAKSQ
jgi:hypothetical protein